MADSSRQARGRVRQPAARGPDGLSGGGVASGARLMGAFLMSELSCGSVSATVIRYDKDTAAWKRLQGSNI